MITDTRVGAHIVVRSIPQGYFENGLKKDRHFPTDHIALFMEAGRQIPTLHVVVCQ